VHIIVSLHLLYVFEDLLNSSLNVSQTSPTLVSPVFAITYLGLPYRGSIGFALCILQTCLQAFAWHVQAAVLLQAESLLRHASG